MLEIMIKIFFKLIKFFEQSKLKLTNEGSVGNDKQEIMINQTKHLNLDDEEQKEQGEYDIIEDKNNFFTDFIKKNKLDLIILIALSFIISAAFVLSLLLFSNVLFIFQNEQRLKENFNVVIFLAVVYLIYSIFSFALNSIQM
jgi:hypothetical protein